MKWTACRLLVCIYVVRMPPNILTVVAIAAVKTDEERVRDREGRRGGDYGGKDRDYSPRGEWTREVLIVIDDFLQIIPHAKSYHYLQNPHMSPSSGIYLSISMRMLLRNTLLQVPLRMLRLLRIGKIVPKALVTLSSKHLIV